MSGMRKMLRYVFVLIIALSAFGCRSKVSVITQERVSTDSVIQYRTLIDSVVKRDSVYIRERGDTVLIDRYHYLTKYKERTDTVYVSRTDSIPAPYPVERNLTGWEKVKQKFGGIAFLAIGITAVLLIIKAKFLK
jgi:hypothetical protein